jgi:uncharacterized protein (TIGR02231 family)
MKNFKVIGLILLFATLMINAEEKAIDLSLTSAKIYIAGAELTHNCKIKLKEGYNDIVLSGISFNLDPNSITVKVSGSGSVQSVTNTLKSYYDGDKPEMIAILEDSIQTINQEINKLNNIISTLDIEMDFINKNMNLNKKDVSVLPSELKEMADFIYERIVQNKNLRLTTNLEIESWRKISAKLSVKINELQQEYGKKYKRDQNIEVSIYSPKAEEVKIEVTYYTPSAGWNAFYEARIDEINKPYDLILKANVWQMTGFDWEKIPITISSKTPMQNNNLPVLSSVYLDFIDTYQKRADYIGKNTTNTSDVVVMSKSGLSNGQTYEAIQSEDATPEFDDANRYKALAVSNPNTYSSFEYTSVNNYSIPGSGKKQLIEIEKFSQEASFEYYSAPKMQQTAYLVAKSANKYGMEMLSGEVSVYFEKSFIGKSYLDFNTISDSIRLSLGIDKGVSVKKESIKDFTESKFLSSDIERSFGYKITVRNNKKQKVLINLEEVVPVTRNEKIDIKLINLSGGKLNKDTGKVVWQIELEPGKSIEKELVFSVKHPKDRRISNF